jgi:hypothetical protein
LTVSGLPNLTTAKEIGRDVRPGLSPAREVTKEAART